MNDGAVKALHSKRRCSLLPVGIIGVEGMFSEGEVIGIRDAGGDVLGVGVANYSSRAVELLKGRKTWDVTDTEGLPAGPVCDYDQLAIHERIRRLKQHDAE